MKVNKTGRPINFSYDPYLWIRLLVKDCIENNEYLTGSVTSYIAVPKKVEIALIIDSKLRGLKSYCTLTELEKDRRWDSTSSIKTGEGTIFIRSLIGVPVITNKERFRVVSVGQYTL